MQGKEKQKKKKNVKRERGKREVVISPHLKKKIDAMGKGMTLEG